VPTAAPSNLCVPSSLPLLDSSKHRRTRRRRSGIRQIRPSTVTLDRVPYRRFPRQPRSRAVADRDPLNRSNHHSRPFRSMNSDISTPGRVVITLSGMDDAEASAALAGAAPADCCQPGDADSLLQPGRLGAQPIACLRVSSQPTRFLHPRNLLRAGRAIAGTYIPGLRLAPAAGTRRATFPGQRPHLWRLS
jgi:hypothetical protein